MKRLLTDEDADADAEKSTASPAAAELNEQKLLYEMINKKKKLAMKKPKIILNLFNISKINNSNSSINSRAESDETGEKAMKNGGDVEKPIFFVQDLQRVVLFSLIGDQFRFYPRWCRILRPKLFKSVHLVTINNVSDLDYRLNERSFRKFNKLFMTSNNNTNNENDNENDEDGQQLNSIDFISATANASTFFNEFISVPITRAQWLKLRDEEEFKIKRADVVRSYKNLYNKIRHSQVTNQNNQSNQHHSSMSSTTSMLDKIPRTSLLMNLNQMLREDYPVPFDTSDRHNMIDYVYSKRKSNYEPVDDINSPLYAIDCEMCFNVDGEMEVVWLALVNEQLECVYETFVKPLKQIRNYLTFITGVREETLRDVQVTLQDVYKRLDELLPPNAILCGQSLNNDLHALRMFHPYCIDTGIIYNLSGNRDIKPSLKRLSAQFLGKLIQESTHNPVVDATASMKLTLLKLRNGLDFGDVIVNGCTNIYDEANLKDSASSSTLQCFVDSHMFSLDLSDPAQISKFIYQTGLNIDQNLFNLLRTSQVKSIFIDNKRFESNRSIEMDKNESVDLRFGDDNQQLKEFHLRSLTADEQYKFTWVQYHIENKKDDNDDDVKNQIDRKDLKRLLKFLIDVYDRLPDDSLFMVVLAGRSKRLNNSGGESTTSGEHRDLFKGRCFLKLKSVEFESLNDQVRRLYNKLMLKNNNESNNGNGQTKKKFFYDKTKNETH